MNWKQREGCYDVVLPEGAVGSDPRGDCAARRTKPNQQGRTRREATRSNERTAAEPGADTRRPAAAFSARIHRRLEKPPHAPIFTIRSEECTMMTLVTRNQWSLTPRNVTRARASGGERESEEKKKKSKEKNEPSWLLAKEARERIGVICCYSFCMCVYVCEWQ